jgi:chromosome segregation ATPase
VVQKVNVEPCYNSVLAGEKRCIALELGLQKLEDERSRHMTRILQLEERLADLDLANTSHDSRLAQRTQQVTQLQAQVGELSQQVTTLEREVRGSILLI